MRLIERIAALALAVGALNSCLVFPGPDFVALREEHFVRIDAAHDVVDWISIEHDLVRGSESAGALRGVLAGRRVFPSGGGWISLDLEKLSQGNDGRQPTEPLDEATEEESAAAKRIRELAPGVGIVEVALGLEAKGSLALWRRTRIEHASEWLKLLADEELRVESERHGMLDTFPVFDARTLELALLAQESGERFWKFRDDSLVFEMPMTPANAARCVARITDAAAESKGGYTRTLLNNLRELKIADERLHARFGPDESGWIALTDNHAKTEKLQRITATWAGEHGLAVEPVESFAARRRAAGLR